MLGSPQQDLRVTEVLQAEPGKSDREKGHKESEKKQLVAENKVNGQAQKHYSIFCLGTQH